MAVTAAMVKLRRLAFAAVFISLANGAAADSYLSISAMPAMRATPSIESRPQTHLPAVSLLLPLQSDSELATAETATTEHLATAPQVDTRAHIATIHPWLKPRPVKPDLFEQFTNNVTSNRQRYIVGVAITEYSITGIRAAMRF